MRTTLDLPDALFHELKEQAALRGLKLEDWLITLVEQGLREMRSLQRRRSPLPVARRAMPGQVTPAQSNARLNQILDDQDAQRRGQRPS